MQLCPAFLFQDQNQNESRAKLQLTGQLRQADSDKNALQDQLDEEQDARQQAEQRAQQLVQQVLFLYLGYIRV